MRYHISPPDAYNESWMIHDAQKDHLVVAEFHRWLPNAGKLVYDLCDKLNQQETKNER